MVYSDAFVKHATVGPFPGRIDPWSEAGHYFQQIHSEMISHFLSQIQDPLLELGYVAGREASLQIAEGREPDIYVQRAMDAPASREHWQYALAAEEILAEPGVVMDTEFDLDALHIKQVQSGRLVTVIEIISPNNKTKPDVIAGYRARRERLVLEHSVNVVEIDPTRSVKRLVNDAMATQNAYHVAIFLAGDSPYLIGIDFGQPLKRIALPLRRAVIPLELQIAYDHAYRLVAAAVQMNDDGFYLEDNLPFPSLLTEAQRHEAVEVVQKWRNRLEQLKSERT